MAFSWFAVSCLVTTFVLTSGSLDYCTDADGNTHAKGDSWEEGVELCECIHPASLFYFWDNSAPADLISHCLKNGCPTEHSATAVVKAGETFVHDGDDCTCVEGTSPGLMDTYTLYHGECKNGLLNYDVSFD